MHKSSYNGTMPEKKPQTSFGVKLRALRQAKKLSQQELATKLGHKGPNAGAWISNFEAGRHKPTLDTLKKMAPLLGVPWEKLAAA